jgi:hypothetical protein
MQHFLMGKSLELGVLENTCQPLEELMASMGIETWFAAVCR